MKHSKGKILSAGAKLVWQKGFNDTGLQEILREAGVPKGSFYYYFDSKETFGLELIDVYISLIKLIFYLVFIHLYLYDIIFIFFY